MAGGKRFAHLLHFGEGAGLLGAVFGIERLPKASTTLTRLLGKIETWEQAEALAEGLWKFCFGLIPWEKEPQDYLTFDSKVLTRYGHQEGAKKGYNRKKPGRPSHHPVLAFLNQSRYVVNFWNRAGNAASSENIVAFARQTLERLEGKASLLGVLADVAFYRSEFVHFLEEVCKLEYVIAAPFYQVVQSRCISEKLIWRSVIEGIEVTEFWFQHRAEGWEKPRRYIVVRDDVGKVAEPLGKQLTLFGIDELLSRKYRYRVYLVSSQEDAVALWRRYRARADDENRIKELGEDFGLEGFSLKKFFSTEAALLFEVFLYDLINFFRREILPQRENRQRAATLRYKYWAIPAIGGIRGKQLVLRLGVISKKLRAKIRYLLSRITNGFFACGVQLQCS